MASSHRIRVAAIGLAVLFVIVAPPARAGDPPNTTAIDRVLGQLAAADEAVLREVLQAMREAEAATRSGRDPAGERRFAEWEDIFIARLARLPLPDGTRAALRAGLADYSRQAPRAMEPAEGTPRMESLATLTGH